MAPNLQPDPVPEASTSAQTNPTTETNNHQQAPIYIIPDCVNGSEPQRQQQPLYVLPFIPNQATIQAASSANPGPTSALTYGQTNHQAPPSYFPISFHAIPPPNGHHFEPPPDYESYSRDQPSVGGSNRQRITFYDDALGRNSRYF